MQSIVKVRLIQAIAFLSAFLLFQVEMIIAKVFLPNFGGSYMVWGACVVFFQAVLMLGYKYAQLVVDKWGMQRYSRWHIGLAFLPLLSYPGRALPLALGATELPLVFAVFWQLCVLIGLVFFVLSTTSVIWQVWLSTSDLPERNNPYALFAVSNTGSLVALLSYPFFFELFLDLSTQQFLWRVGYGLFLILQVLALRMIPVQVQATRQKPLKKVAIKKVIPWLCYSAAGVMMFLAVTNILTAEVAPVPLLWVLPLVIYLVSFILNFKKKPYCPHWLRDDMTTIAGLAAVVYFVVQVPMFPLLLDMSLLLVVTYLFCMHAQYQVYRSRPSDHRYLPYFYFIVSLGSFLGGIIVSWVIPFVSVTYIEYFAAFFVLSLANFQAAKQRLNVSSVFIPVAIFIILMLWPAIFAREDVRHTWVQYGGLMGLLLLVPVLFEKMKGQPKSLIGCLMALTIMTPYIENRWTLTEHIYRYRNFYGTGKVRQNEGARSLVHGTTIHGTQYVHAAFEHLPLSYYGYRSPIGEVLLQDDRRFDKIGVIGLGIGTMATYFRDYQQIDIFELDEDMHYLATKFFRFLAKAKGNIDHYLGDGRLLLQDMPDDSYDLLVIDAFSGDAIPIHLLTEEALQLYRRKLKSDGILLCHISNRYIFIGAPLTQTAQSVHAKPLIKEGAKREAHDQSSLWLAMTWDDQTYRLMDRQWSWRQVAPATDKLRSWTDAYNTVMPYIDFADLIREFRFFLRAG